MIIPKIIIVYIFNMFYYLQVFIVYFFNVSKILKIDERQDLLY